MSPCFSQNEGPELRVLVEVQTDAAWLIGVNLSGKPLRGPLPFSLYDTGCLTAPYVCIKHPKGHVCPAHVAENPGQECQV